MDNNVYFHVTEICNLNSIRRKGLLPQIPRIHNFTEYGINKVTYTIEDSNKNIKFFNDMIYCKTHIDKVNDYNEKTKRFELWKDFSFDLSDKYYAILATFKQPWSNAFIHEQSENMGLNGEFNFMPDKYSHNDKVIGLYYNTIHSKDIFIAGYGMQNFTKSLTIKSKLKSQNKWIKL